MHRPFNNKMKMIQPLLNHPELRNHVPETAWYSTGQVKELLTRYSVLFIKPNKGRIGIGVMRLKVIPDAGYEVHYLNQSNVYLTQEQAILALEQHFIPGKKYIVQRGISLAEVLDRPFDFRVVMHKLDEEWEKTAWCAKISPPKLIVTNHARGGIIITVDQALKANKARFDYEKASRKLLDTCYCICEVFDNHFSLRKLGLDMAIDKDGHIWFIEGNTRPDHAMFRKLGIPYLYEFIKRRDRRILALRDAIKVPSQPVETADEDRIIR